MKPVIAITMGDAAGIGAEVIVKALNRPEVYEGCRPVVIGDAKLLERELRLADPGVRIQRIARIDESEFRHGLICCLDLDLLPNDLPYGRVSAAAGDAAYRFIEKAVALALEQQVDAICTAPLNKEALHMGGHLYPGHTEILAALTGTDDFSMMLSTPKLKVIHLTTTIV